MGGLSVETALERIGDGGTEGGGVGPGVAGAL